MELSGDFQEKTSFGNWYALQFQAVTAAVLTCSRLDPTAARGLLLNFKEEFCKTNFDFWWDPILEIDTTEISKIWIRLSNEYGSEFNKVDPPDLENVSQDTINNNSFNYEKIDPFDKNNCLQPDKVDIEQQIQPLEVKSAAVLYAQKRRNRLKRESKQRKKKLIIGAIFIVLIITAIVLMIVYL